MKPAPWSVRTVNTKKGQYAIVAGIAYPSVVQGANRTKAIAASLKSRKFWSDPAIVLSTDDLDSIDGAEGAPLCVEHNRNDVVGGIHHSYIDHDDPQKGLRIMARIPLNERGRQIVQDIKNKKLNGFSVRYDADLSRQNKVDSKMFHEISLVNQPHFDGCNLTVSVAASANGQGKVYRNNCTDLHINNCNSHLIKCILEEEQLFVPFEPMSEQQTENPAATESVPLKEMESMVKQTDYLKEQLNESNRAREQAEQARMSAEEKQELEALRKERAARLQAYAEKNKDKAAEYIKWREEQDGAPLKEEEKKMFTNVFTNPGFERDALRFEGDMKRTVELAASKQLREKELEDYKAAQQAELEKLKAEKQKLTELIGQGSANMRASYAAALQNKHVLEEPKMEDEGVRRTVGVAASRDDASMIMMARPSAEELGFLQAYNFTNKVSIAASSDPYAPQERLFRDSIQAAPLHRQLRDEDGELNFPASMRYTNPSVFAWMVNESGLPQTPDLSNYVQFNSSKTFTEPKRVGEQLL